MPAINAWAQRKPLARTILTIIAFAIVFGLLAGCAAQRIIGTVVAKDFKAGYTYIWNQPLYTTVCSSNGKTTTCRQQFSGFIPWVMYQPPCYQLTVQTDDDDRKHTCVSASEWDHVKIGDHFDSEPWKPEPVKDHRQ